MPHPDSRPSRGGKRDEPKRVRVGGEFVPVKGHPRTSVSAERIQLLRRHAIAGALLYGIGVFIVMNMLVIPLSAAPVIPPPTLPWLIEIVVDHMLVVGLPLGILVRRNANSNK